MDCIDEDTGEIMDAAHHSLKRIFPSDLKLIIYGQCKDSSGGGTKSALAREVQSRNIAHAHTISFQRVPYKIYKLA